VPAEAFKNIPVHNKWIYQTNTPAPPLTTVEAQMAAVAGKPPNPFVFRLGDMAESRDQKWHGADRGQHQLLVSKTIAASQVRITDLESGTSASRVARTRRSLNPDRPARSCLSADRQNLGSAARHQRQQTYKGITRVTLASLKQKRRGTALNGRA
jgi:hypothetical protein